MDDGVDAGGVDDAVEDGVVLVDADELGVVELDLWWFGVEADDDID